MTENTIWSTNCPLPNALAIAVHTGQLANALTSLGVHVNLLRQESSAEVRLSHFRHTVRGQVRHGGHIPPLWSRAEGRDVKLLGLSWTRESQWILVREDSPIQALQDLRGKRLAVPVRADLPIDFWQATTLKAWTSALKLSGLKLSDAVLVPIAVPAVEPRVTSSKQIGDTEFLTQGVAEWTLSAQRREAFALLNGEVDAIFSPAHYGATLRRFLGARILADLTSSKEQDTWLNNATLLALTVDGVFFEQNREAVDTLVASLRDAAQWAKQNRTEAARIFAAETGNPEELIEEIFGAEFEQLLDLTLSSEALRALESQNRFLHERGFVSRIVPPEEWVESGPLERTQRTLVAAELRQDE
jgi:ABC-type nitrate/sulfonate/bicarbonate transport system substrate-binding protein